MLYNFDFFGDRLKSLIPNGMSQSEFARNIGVANSTLSLWLAGGSMPKADALSAIAAFIDVDLNWLITGEKAPTSSGEEDFVPVRRLHIRGSAGVGATNGLEEEGEPIAFRRDWLRSHVGVPVEYLSVIQAGGDSMEPTIRDGSLVLVNHNIERIENDGIYAFSIDGDLYIKRIQKAFGGGIVIKSDNPSYDDQTISDPEAANIKIVGLIKWAANAY